jgi:hypothetical protein
MHDPLVGRQMRHPLAGGAGSLLASKVGSFLASAEGGQWEAFFEAWDSAFDNRQITVSEVIRELATNFDLRDVIPDWLADSYYRDPGKFRQQLGQALLRQRGAQYGLWRLERAGTNRRKVALWRMVQVPEANDQAA